MDEKEGERYKGPGGAEIRYGEERVEERYVCGYGEESAGEYWEASGIVGERKEWVRREEEKKKEASSP